MKQFFLFALHLVFISILWLDLHNRMSWNENEPTIKAINWNSLLVFFSPNVANRVENINILTSCLASNDRFIAHVDLYDWSLCFCHREKQITRTTQVSYFVDCAFFIENCHNIFGEFPWQPCFMCVKRDLQHSICNCSESVCSDFDWAQSILHDKHELQRPIILVVSKSVNRNLMDHRIAAKNTQFFYMC